MVRVDLDNLDVKTLNEITGTVNDRPFRGFSAGEVLMVGASGKRRGSKDWDIELKFSALPNVTNLRIGNIVGIDMKGRDCLDIRYARRHNIGKAAEVPVEVSVYEVYNNTNFSRLQIGPITDPSLWIFAGGEWAYCHSFISSRYQLRES